MNINLKQQSDGGYKDSKEYLERQQNIDTLLALARIAEVVRPTSDLDSEIVKKIGKIIEKL